MIDSIMYGTTIGYAVFVLVYELKMKLCRLCCVWWLSVLAALLLWNFASLGILNLVAHATFFILKVTNDGIPKSVENLLGDPPRDSPKTPVGRTDEARS